MFAVKGFPPVGSGSEGTIGAAQKYQAPQLADKDVVLGDAAVQEFLQSDVFDRLIKDPDARELLNATRTCAPRSRTRRLRSAIRDADVRAALTNANVRNAMPRRGQALASAELRNASMPS